VVPEPKPTHDVFDQFTVAVMDWSVFGVENPDGVMSVRVVDPVVLLDGVKAPEADVEPTAKLAAVVEPTPELLLWMDTVTALAKGCSLINARLEFRTHALTEIVVLAAPVEVEKLAVLMINPVGLTATAALPSV
jgi:hypothetical protein